VEIDAQRSEVITGARPCAFPASGNSPGFLIGNNFGDDRICASTPIAATSQKLHGKTPKSQTWISLEPVNLETACMKHW
jgi:hypothetical protein